MNEIKNQLFWEWTNEEISWPDFKCEEVLVVTPEIKGKVAVDGNWYYYNGVHYARLITLEEIENYSI